MGNYDRQNRNDSRRNGGTKKPWGRAFAVIGGNDDGEKGQWLEIGVAWENRDGGLSIIIDREPMAPEWRKGERRILIQRPKEER